MSCRAAPSTCFLVPLTTSVLNTLKWTLSCMQVGILQFSNDVRVELQPQVVDRDVFDKKLEIMVRNCACRRSTVVHCSGCASPSLC